MNINASTSEGGQTNIDFDKKPDKCAICHNGIDPIFVSAFIKTSEGPLEVVYRCTKHDCLSLFIGYYLDIYTSTGVRVHGSGRFLLQDLQPYHPEVTKFSESILKVSPNFCEIYNQAEISEGFRLDLICGLGYRKALEFLVKDFAIEQNPGKSDEIKKTFLGSCINNYISDQNIKDCASRAAWLANDEAHYVKKWEDKDISDLKILIQLTRNWIENVKLTEKYKREMDKSS